MHLFAQMLEKNHQGVPKNDLFLAINNKINQSIWCTKKAPPFLLWQIGRSILPTSPKADHICNGCTF